MGQTVGFVLATKLKSLNVKMDEVIDEIDEVVNELLGAEFQYKDYCYSMIDHIEEDVVYLYCENSEGDQYDLRITLDELVEILS